MSSFFSRFIEIFGSRPKLPTADWLEGLDIANKSFAPLPTEIATRWSNANARIAELTYSVNGELYFWDKEKGGSGKLPGFSLSSSWTRAETLLGLPKPDIPFGINLDRKQLRDFPFDLFTTFAHLTALSIEHGSVSQEEAATLTAAPGLRSMHLSEPDSASLSELVKLSQLQSLFVNLAAVGEDLAELLKVAKPSLPKLGMVLPRKISVEHCRMLREIDRIRAIKITEARIAADGISEIAKASQLRAMDLSQADITDDALRLLRSLNGLSYLKLDDTQVTDAGIQYLANLRMMKSLSLSGCDKVSDLGLKQISQCSQIETLNLRGTKVTDQGVKSLGQLRKIKGLFLGGAPITDSVFGDLSQLENLDDLDFLTCKKVSGRGADALQRCKKLAHLNCTMTGISDAGLEGISKISSLRWLNISHTPVTTAGVTKLAALANLKFLGMKKCPQVALEAVGILRQALPELRISFDGPTSD